MKLAIVACFALASCMAEPQSVVTVRGELIATNHATIDNLQWPLECGAVSTLILYIRTVEGPVVAVEVIKDDDWDPARCWLIKLGKCRGVEITAVKRGGMFYARPEEIRICRERYVQ